MTWRMPEEGEEEFCTNMRRWMFKRAFSIPKDCPGNLFGSETSCPENCGYLEIRKMPLRVKRLHDLMTGKS